LKMPGLAFLLAVLLVRANLVLSGGCHVHGDCPADGTVNGDWEDDWGCDNVNACWDEAACCDRVNGIADWCGSNNLCTTFTDTGHECCIGNGGGGTTSGGGGGDGDYDYADVLGKSILFYEAQRSGYYEGRVSWRGDSATNDFGPNGEDLVGGYYDAGDNLKLHFPFVASFTMLAWSAISFPEAYNSAGEMQNLKNGIRWATDYMLKCHVAPDVLFAQVGDVNADHGFWGRPEDMDMYRPAQSISPSNPGSDLASDYASAMASAAMVFREEDPSYAATLIEHAKQLLQFAEDHQGFYSDNIDNGGTYGSYNDKDEQGLAAAWLAKATGEAEYVSKAEWMYDNFDGSLDYSGAWINWEDKTPAFVAVMCENTGDPKYCNQLGTWCDNKIDNSQYSPKGEIFIDKWGSLRHAGNVAAICMRAASLGVNSDKYLNFVKKQIGYILGDTGRSFVVGYGTNPPTHCHHRGASCTPSGCCDPNCWDPNPNVLTGALVGGPGEPNDYYEDRRDDFVANEVALDYNAGFQFAVAGLHATYGVATTPAPSTMVSEPATTPAPTAASTGGPQTTANHDCPGGSLHGCIELCPSENETVFQNCVQDCMAMCPN